MFQNSDIHPLFQYQRDDSSAHNAITVDLSHKGHPVPPTILSSFLEHLAFSIQGGVTAQLLNNPTFHRDPNLTPQQVEELNRNAEILVRVYLSGGNPEAFRKGWSYIPLETGFGVAVLDDSHKDGIPYGWGPLGYSNGATGSAGRLGGAVRLQGGTWPEDPRAWWPVTEDGPAGVRQGVWLPIKRCLAYQGRAWVRIVTGEPTRHGEVEVGLRRRLSTPDGQKAAGEHLASLRVPIQGTEWQILPFAFSLEQGQVAIGEPVDFTFRWIPRSHNDLHLLVDRIELYPDDAVFGLDPEVVRLAKDWPVPLLRWPGGNFVSYYHWRDGVGPLDRRPTCPNRAWGGLDYNIFGTDEFVRFCRFINAEPHITVNACTAYPEEAAAWVEYCNGAETTPMGRLRAKNGHPEPYNVAVWEVGNEVWGTWQGGFHGSDEYACRFSAFAEQMRAASPIPIKIIATGNNFDFAIPGTAYDHTNADQRWHDQLLQHATDQIDLISLHSLPVNDHLLEAVSDEDAHRSVLSQITTWERHFLPDLLARCDSSTRSKNRPPIQLAITEWGPLGTHPNRLMVENFGGVVYAGAFLNMMARNCDRIPLANTTGFMHGGCIHKSYGTVFFDPQYLTIQQYACFIGAAPLGLRLTGPGYDVIKHADLGAPEKDVPYIDALVCQSTDRGRLLAAIANKHPKQSMIVTLRVPGYALQGNIKVTRHEYREIAARTTPIQTDLCPLSHEMLESQDGKVTITLAPFSVCWLEL